MRRLTAQDIASALLDGRYSEEWQALVASVSEAQQPLPNAIEADVIQDVGDRPFWIILLDGFLAKTHHPRLRNASVVENGSIAISALILSSQATTNFFALLSMMQEAAAAT